ncbi:hypothetical protein AB4071_02725 [Stenotrophomonas sp. 2MCAF14_2]|uniref:hypothetical protein n=1 Tax=Stenotrophomonas sp. 2MCAF14_2 TaxID=3232983 RepID=UPI003F96BC62
MTDWKNTEYGIPKTWKEIEEERIDAELAKKSASPAGILSLIALMTVLLAGCVIGLLWMILR